MTSGRILLVDDQEAILEVLSRFLSGRNYEITTSLTGLDAISRIRNQQPDLVILDMVLPDIGGMEVLRQALNVMPDLPVIVLTGFGTVEHAVEAMKLGAREFLMKPIQLDRIAVAVNRILEHKILKLENAALLKRLGSVAVSDNIVAASKVMRDVMTLVDKAGPLPSTVLVEGETGTGKELIARALHARSSRAKGPFVGINCGVIPASLQESEMFGYEKGAFTGADESRVGYFEAARGGTLFLDEIGDMSMRLQVKLLRVLQEKLFRRLGSTTETPSDVRVVASTNRYLEEEIKHGRFRKDLFYRLSVITVHLPPLRERPEDIPLISYHFLRRFAQKFGKVVKGIAPEVLDAFLGYRWDGNIRELENVVERAVAVCDGEEIRPRDLPAYLREASLVSDPAREIHLEAFSVAKENFEKRYLLALLRAAEGNVSEASRIAAIHRSKLYEKLKRYGIQIRRPPKPH